MVPPLPPPVRPLNPDDEVTRLLKVSWLAALLTAAAFAVVPAASVHHELMVDKPLFAVAWVGLRNRLVWAEAADAKPRPAAMAAMS